jgi:dimethylhistidine N-methyltransferase
MLNAIAYAEATSALNELRRGLQARPARVSPKYFYDTLGSRLFAAITELAEYYPTRTEASIFKEHATEIASGTGQGATLIDLGAGNCAKAAGLFHALRPSRYVAVDISINFLKQSMVSLQHQFPSLPMVALGLDFSASLDLPPALLRERCQFFYPGTSIGNFVPSDALALLRQIRCLAGDCGGLLIGVDRIKPRELLEPAYDDALGVTAAFNLNILRHVNRLLRANFNVGEWRHVAFLNEAECRIEMHLQAQSVVEVQWCGGGRRFESGERIHTESSYKYMPQDFDALLHDAGFSQVRHWSDPQGWFSVVHASA